MDKIYPKRIQIQEIEQHHWIPHMLIRLATKFRRKPTILTFCRKFAQKGHFQLITKKVNTATEFSIFELIYVPNFSSNWQFWHLYQICAKRVFPVENKKSEQHHWILPSQNSLESVSKQYETFWCFTKFYFHRKWNDGRLLLINMVYTSCRTT